MTATQRYELIRPIIQKEKTIQQVHKENDISIRTLWRYLKRFLKGDEQIESLADKSHAAFSHPKWFTCEQKELVVAYKLANPPISAQQISKDLAEKGILKINAHSVADILKARGLTKEFFLTHRQNPMMIRKLSFQRAFTHRPWPKPSALPFHYGYNLHKKNFWL